MNFDGEVAHAKTPAVPCSARNVIARTFGNEPADFLPAFSRERIGFHVWGLCAGSA